MRTVPTNARTTLAAIVAGVAIILTATPAAAISSANSSPAPERTEVGFLGEAVDLDGDGTLDVLGAQCSGTERRRRPQDLADSRFPVVWSV